MQISDALQIAKRVSDEAEVQGFFYTAQAMRQVLHEMAFLECAPDATNPLLDCDAQDC